MSVSCVADVGPELVSADEAGDKGTRRVLEDLTRSARLADVPVIHHDH